MRHATCSLPFHNCPSWNFKVNGKPLPAAVDDMYQSDALFRQVSAGVCCCLRCSFAGHTALGLTVVCGSLRLWRGTRRNQAVDTVSIRPFQKRKRKNKHACLTSLKYLLPSLRRTDMFLKLNLQPHVSYTRHTTPGPAGFKGKVVKRLRNVAREMVPRHESRARQEARRNVRKMSPSERREVERRNAVARREFKFWDGYKQMKAERRAARKQLVEETQEPQETVEQAPL